MTTFLAVRHAHAVWNDDVMRPLSPAGMAQAKVVAGLLSDRPIDAIWSSDERRARQTVEPLASRLGLPIHEDRGLRERVLGGGRFDDFEAAVERTWLDPATAPHPGGEPNEAAQRRFVAVWSRLEATHPEGTVVVATHGSVLTLGLAALDPRIGLDFWRRMSFPDVYDVRRSPGGGLQVTRLWRASVE